MGRSSKNEPIEEKPRFQETSATKIISPGSGGSPTNFSRGAVSESESMARDIKEGRLSGYVGHGTVLTGETNFQSMLRIDGHLTGRVTSESGTLIVGSTGQVDANIMVASANINGTINGDIIATEKLELGRTAHVVGNVQTPRLVMDDGAVLEGSCSMIKARENLEKRHAEADAQKSANEAAAYQTEIVEITPVSDEFSDEDAEENAEAAVR